MTRRTRIGQRRHAFRVDRAFGRLVEYLGVSRACLLRALADSTDPTVELKQAAYMAWHDGQLPARDAGYFGVVTRGK